MTAVGRNGRYRTVCCGYAEACRWNPAPQKPSGRRQQVASWSGESETTTPGGSATFGSGRDGCDEAGVPC